MHLFKKIPGTGRQKLRVSGKSYVYFWKDIIIVILDPVKKTENFPAHYNTNDYMLLRIISVLFMPYKSEAKSLLFNLGQKKPIQYNGEVEDSNENYFILRIADHVQFYTFNNNVDKGPAQKSSNILVLGFSQDPK